MKVFIVTFVLTVLILSISANSDPLKEGEIDQPEFGFVGSDAHPSGMPHVSGNSFRGDSLRGDSDTVGGSDFVGGGDFEGSNDDNGPQGVSPPSSGDDSHS